MYTTGVTLCYIYKVALAYIGPIIYKKGESFWIRGTIKKAIELLIQ